MPDGRAVGGDRRQPQVADRGQRVQIEGRRRTTLAVPRRELRQLVREHDCLDRVEPRRPAFARMDVLGRLAVLAQRTHAGGDLTVTGHERSGVAGCPEVLAGVEAERRCGARGAGALTLARRAVCLTGVLDDRDTCVIGEATQLGHVRQLAIEVHRHHRVRTWAECSRDGPRVQAVITL